MCGGGPGSGGGEGDDPGFGDANDGETGQGLPGNVGDDSGMSQGGFDGLGIGNPSSYGGSPPASGAGQSDASGLAAAEAASAALADADPANMSFTPAELSSIVTSLTNTDISKNLSDETLAKAFIAANEADDTDSHSMAKAFNAEMTNRGHIPAHAAGQNTTAAQLASFVADSVISNTLSPALATASKVPALGHLTSLMSTEPLISRELDVDLAEQTSRSILGLPDPPDPTIAKGTSKTSDANTPGRPGGAAPPEAAQSETLAVKTKGAPPTMASRTMLGGIGRGRAGDVATSLQGLLGAPEIKRRKLGG